MGKNEQKSLQETDTLNLALIRMYRTAQLYRVKQVLGSVKEITMKIIGKT